jgi:hypothetical protein
MRLPIYASFKKGSKNGWMSEVRQKISVLEVRRLLVELREHRPDICLRYRLIGQMWATNFLRVIQVTDEGVLLRDETSNRVVRISELAQMMQLEIDKPFQAYKPYCHYDVVLSSEW